MDERVARAFRYVLQWIPGRPLLLYGGAAIALLQHKKARFLADNIVDVDLLCPEPQYQSLLLVDSLYGLGFRDVNVICALHLETFRVRLEKTVIVDISRTDRPIFERLWRERVTLDRLPCAPPNYLRMCIYLELSHPKNMPDRWTKLLPRLAFLNEAYPARVHDLPAPQAPDEALLQRLFEYLRGKPILLVGLNAARLHGEKRKFPEWGLPADLLFETPEAALACAAHLDAKTEFRTPRTDFLPAFFGVEVGGRRVGRFFVSQDCHSYHETSQGICVASLPTLINLGFGLYYAGLDSGLELEMCETLVSNAQETSRRYKELSPRLCVGRAMTAEEYARIRKELYDRLSLQKFDSKFLKYFFFYKPDGLREESRLALRRRVRALE